MQGELHFQLNCMVHYRWAVVPACCTTQAWEGR